MDESFSEGFIEPCASQSWDIQSKRQPTGLGEKHEHVHRLGADGGSLKM